MENLKASLAVIRNNVWRILEEFPETRNNDRLLEARYMHEFHGVTSLYVYAAMKELPSLDTILRRRREIQEEGHFLPTDPAVIRRRTKLSNSGINSGRTMYDAI